MDSEHIDPLQWPARHRERAAKVSTDPGLLMRLCFDQTSYRVRQALTRNPALDEVMLLTLIPASARTELLLILAHDACTERVAGEMAVWVLRDSAPDHVVLSRLAADQRIRGQLLLDVVQARIDLNLTGGFDTDDRCVAARRDDLPRDLAAALLTRC